MVVEDDEILNRQDLANAKALGEGGDDDVVGAKG
jgi:hypothetical protein